MERRDFSLFLSLFFFSLVRRCVWGEKGWPFSLLSEDERSGYRVRSIRCRTRAGSSFPCPPCRAARIAKDFSFYFLERLWPCHRDVRFLCVGFGNLRFGEKRDKGSSFLFTSSDWARVRAPDDKEKDFIRISIWGRTFAFPRLAERQSLYSFLLRRGRYPKALELPITCSCLLFLQGALFACSNGKGGRIWQDFFRLSISHHLPI